MMNGRMIGREKEKSIISQSINQVLESKGRTLLINGEAGLGKTTLVEHLKAEAGLRGMNICIGEATAQDSSVPYLPFQRALSGIVDTQLFQSEEFVYFDEVFLISKIGLLISHVSRSTEEGLDEDILGSMLTAVQDFVKDSFGDGGADTQKGGLGKLEYMNTKIFIEHGDLIYMAVVASGEEHPDMKQEIRKHLAEIESRYYDILADWDGDIDSLSGTVDILNKAVAKHFRIKRSLENINLESERIKMQNKVLDIITEHAGDNGLLLVLEDMHWADASSIHAIPYIARNITESNILLCITYRPDDLDLIDDDRRKIIGVLSSESTCSTVITLDPVDEDTLEKIAINTLGGGRPPDELIANLRTEADGNPFFIIEAIRALNADGTLYKDGDIWVLKYGPKSVIPHSVSELISRRLETFDLDCLRFIEYGAVLGRYFDRSMLAAGFSLETIKVNQIIDSLLELNIFTKLQGDDLMFQHSKTQEVIYSSLSERWRKALHRNAGLILEARNKDDLDNVLFNLAYHFSNAQDYEKGIEYCISAGYKASNNLAPKESIQFFEQATKLITISGKTDDRFAEINETLGELHELDGNYPAALTRYETVLDLTQEMPNTARILMKKGRVFQAQSKYDEAISTFEQGISLATETGFIFWKAKINGYLGKIYLRKGEYEKALELQKTYLNESKNAGDNREVGQAYMNLGGVYLHLNNNQMAVQNWEKSLAYFKEVGYEQGVAYVNDNLGVAHLWAGKFEKALEYYESSMEIMKKIGDVKGISTIYLNIGVLYNRMGQYEMSLEFNRKSLQIKRKIGDSVGVANIYNNIGGNYLDMGRYEESIENFKLNLEIMEKSGDVWGVAQALSNIAEPELELGRTDEARMHCLRSIEIAEKHSFKDIFSYGYMIMGTLSCQDGDTETADKYFADSLFFAKETEEPERTGRAHLAIARSFLRRGEKEKAIDNYGEAFKVFEKAQMETLAKKAREEMQQVIEEK